MIGKPKTRRVVSNLTTQAKPGATPHALGYRMPAEWAAHQATFVVWPHKAGDWPGKVEVMGFAMAELARQLSRGERVCVLVSDATERRRADSVLGRAGVDMTQLDFVALGTDRSWARDSLPCFVVKSGRETSGRETSGREKSGRETSGRVGAVKWRFDGWHRYPDHHLDDAAGVVVAERFGKPCWFPEVTVLGRSRRIVLEGGSIDVDGEGTLLTTESCLLTGKRARHRQLGQKGSEELLRQYLGAEKVLWLKEGIAGDDTSGHIDDFARFVGPALVVVAEERRRADPNHKLLAEARERLSGVRDARARRIEVVSLPMPEPVRYGGVRLPASYANFYIGNECVVVPTFNDPADRHALGILGELFPKRRVVGLHALDWVVGLGTLHCSTQQLPR
jgi:agmatine deiminase